ncbi:MAG: 3-oxoacyl-ACP synthase [Bacteroidales bacterium]|nr:3-oxoacyl-ACP synthase [Bacteroidales bacterium]
MVYKIADNVTTPLGGTTEENLRTVVSGGSALRQYQDYEGIPEAFTASLFSKEQRRGMQEEGLTPFESMVVASVRKALEVSAIEVGSERVVFILSTTKGNIALVAEGGRDEREYPGVSARRIAERIGVRTAPIVVCNACISGLAAIILAERLLSGGEYDYAIVSGADSQGKFIISGFQSLKALSAEQCRPFDEERMGLNLGEAAATMILGRKKTQEGQWTIGAGYVRNDGYHISAPSRTGLGARKAIEAVIEGRERGEIACVNAHGTATMFNDQMESVAIEGSGLGDIAVNSLKGYYGHTMGAAGVLETIVTMKAIEEGTVLGTRGYGERGVSGKIKVQKENGKTDKTSFVKMLSGFGGCNAATWCSKEERAEMMIGKRATKTTHRVRITPGTVEVDGEKIETKSTGREMLTELYHERVGDYPKYHKMDMLSKLGFIATELLLGAEGGERFVDREDRAIVFFNRTSSIDTDRHYQETIADAGKYFPSPALFVYTLPNIVTGEIAIRNHYHGETSFYVLAERDEEMIERVVRVTLRDEATQSIVTGWIDYEDEERFEADIRLEEVERWEAR